MRKELLEKKKELLKEIQAIDQSLEIEEMKEDIENLNEFTDILNSMFQDAVVEKYSSEAADLLYQAMQILDKISVGLEDDVAGMEIEKEIENNFSS
jgi:hypothetical protein